MTIHPDAFQGRPLVEDWMIYLLKSIQLPIPSDAAENTARMFRIAKFYLASGAVCISDALMFLSFAGEISRTKLNGLVYETLLTGRAALLGALHNLKDFETLLAKDRHGKMSFRFQVQVESADEMAVEADFRAIMDTVASRTGMAYQILRVGYGSILIEAIATFVGIMVFFRAARSVSYNLAEIRVAHQAGKRCAELARNAQDAQKAAKAIELFRESLPPEPPVSEILVDEVAEMGDSIASLTKSIRAAGSDILGLVKEVRVFMDDVNKGS